MKALLITVLCLLSIHRAQAALTISLTAPSLDSSVVDVSISGSFTPTTDYSFGPEILIWTNIGDVFDRSLQDDFLFSNPIEASTSSQASTFFDGIALDFDGGSGVDDFGLWIGAEPIFAGLEYSVNGSATFDLSKIQDADFSRITQGTYLLPDQPLLGAGHVLEVSLAPIPEPATLSIFFALIAGGLAYRRFASSAKTTLPSSAD